MVVIDYQHKFTTLEIKVMRLKHNTRLAKIDMDSQALMQTIYIKESIKMINIKKIEAKQKLGIALTREEKSSLYAYTKILTKGATK